MNSSTQQNENGTAAGRQNSSVLISGAGFAGLASAWWMNRLGYSVTVVELAKGVRRGGTPVNIRDGVIDVVKRMNLLETDCFGKLAGKAGDLPRRARIAVAAGAFAGRSGAGRGV